MYEMRLVKILGTPLNVIQFNNAANYNLNDKDVVLFSDSADPNWTLFYLKSCFIESLDKCSY